MKSNITKMYGQQHKNIDIDLFMERHVARMGERRCIQGAGGETCGKKTTWKTQA
jgi:hypothetical protein